MSLSYDSVPYELEARRLWRAELEVRRNMANGQFPPSDALEDATMIREMTDRPILALRAGALLAEVFVHQQVAS